MKKLIQKILILITAFIVIISAIRIISWRSEAAYVWELINEQIVMTGGCPNVFPSEKGRLPFARESTLGGQLFCEYENTLYFLGSDPLAARSRIFSQHLKTPTPGQPVHWALFLTHDLKPGRLVPYQTKFPQQPIDWSLQFFNVKNSPAFNAYARYTRRIRDFLFIQLRDGTLVQVFAPAP